MQSNRLVPNAILRREKNVAIALGLEDITGQRVTFVQNGLTALIFLSLSLLRHTDTQRKYSTRIPPLHTFCACHPSAWGLYRNALLLPNDISPHFFVRGRREKRFPLQFLTDLDTCVRVCVRGEWKHSSPLFGTGRQFACERFECVCAG